VDSASPISSIGPTAPAERIDSLDILRGFALFGILWANLPGGGGLSPLDAISDRMEAFLVRGKFFTIFTFAFGVSFSLQFDRAAKQGRSHVTYYLRRLCFLFLIGVCHCVFVWDGDILRSYALFGAYLVAMHRVPQKAILALALCLYSMVLIGGEISLTRRISRETSAAQSARIDPTRLRERRQRMIAEEAQSYATISYQQLVHNRWGEVRESLGRGRTYFPDSSFVLFLLGLWAGRCGVFRDSCSHRRLLRRVVLWGFPVGLTLYFGGEFQRYLLYAGHITWLNGSPLRVGADIGQMAQGLAYVAVILLLLETKRWYPRLNPLRWAGRMALTNYLMQSLVFTVAAYGYGLGLYPMLTGSIRLLYAVLFFTAQALLSRWWLTRFRFGPAEWLWRSLTYWNLQPWRVSIVGHVGHV